MHETVNQDDRTWQEFYLSTAVLPPYSLLGDLSGLDVNLASESTALKSCRRHGQGVLRETTLPCPEASLADTGVFIPVSACAVLVVVLVPAPPVSS
jgi:hypothetical protein